jgi:hypothetical protein
MKRVSGKVRAVRFASRTPADILLDTRNAIPRRRAIG